MLNPIEEIKNRLDIVDVVGGYIKLKKAGANYQAVCPFHSEKKPSFFVSPGRQIWHCFGCGAGGDVFRFIMQIEGVEFGDALRTLAQRAGVELEPIRPELRTQRQRLYEICELSCQFFEKQLAGSGAGKQAQEYLLKRGVNRDSQVIWRLGYAPEVWRSLSDFLNSGGYKKEEIIGAGLAIKNEKGHFYDRFRARIMFPIFDLNSQVVGFSGRIFSANQSVDQRESAGIAAKYMNTPNTLLYDKSRVLYGLNQAKVDIRKRNGCILVEGNVDVILSHQMAVKNAAATCGTALTPYQLSILKRYSGNLILAFDMDVAGDTATKRGIGLAQEKGFDIKIAILPSGKDPAEVISANPEEWERILKDSKSILDFYFENAFSKFDKETPEGKKEIANLLLPVFKRIPNKIVKFHWIQKLAGALRVREKDILDELEKAEVQTTWPAEPVLTIPQKSHQQLLEERLIFLLLKNWKSIELLEEDDAKLLSRQTQEILSAFKNVGPDFNKLKEKISPNCLELLNLLFLEAEIKDENENLEEEFEKCLNRIRCLNIKNELREISNEIREAEEHKEFQKVKSLTEKFNELAKKLNPAPFSKEL